MSAALVVPANPGHASNNRDVTVSHTDPPTDSTSADSPQSPTYWAPASDPGTPASSVSSSRSSRHPADKARSRSARGSLRKPILLLNRIIGHSSAKNHMSKPRFGNFDALDDERQRRQVAKIQLQLAKEDARESERRSLQARRQQEEEKALAQDSPEIADRYGTRLDERADRELLAQSCSLLRTLNSAERAAGVPVAFTARLHHVRNISSKLAFIVFRQQVETVQGVLHVQEGVVSENFVRWAERQLTESFVHIEGVIQLPREPIRGCTVQDVEILVQRMHVVGSIAEPLPMDVYTMDRVEVTHDSESGAQVRESLASNRTRLANRLAFLRTPAAQGIFRIQALVCSIWRSELEGQHFVEIHTPKLQPTATESGAEVFRVNYFNRDAFLAQSPQLAKQLAISADFGRVFEIGPVFRAENSHTHRHLTEFTGLDLEMAIEHDYHEMMHVVDGVLKAMFKGVYAKFRKEIDIIKGHFPHQDLVWLDTTPILTFAEGVAMLDEADWEDEHGEKQSPLDDLSTRAEVRLGQLVKEKYGTDYYILDKFPASARPFYTHPDPEDPRHSNSFDVFLRGQEIISGGQRIHRYETLVQRLRSAGIEPEGMQEYLQGFQFGLLPHAGCGLGLERFVFLLLGLGDIRNASLFPRDPKSMPGQAQQQQAHGVKPTLTFPHPEADTLRFAHNYGQGRRDQPLPFVEDLIANYGDATNTSWLDDRYSVWRHAETGGAVGYAAVNGYALVMGDPLCDPRQMQQVIRAFLMALKQGEGVPKKDTWSTRSRQSSSSNGSRRASTSFSPSLHSSTALRPLWLLCSRTVEEILASKLGWRSLSCVAEERVATQSAKRVLKKERQAAEAGVRIHSTGLNEPVPPDVRERCDVRIEQWKADRAKKGSPQVHITEVAPWVDMRHRRYLWAETRDGEICCMVVLHRLSPQNGYQIKFALDFPGSPSGAIEALISASIQALAKAGVKMVTFGAGATPQLIAGENFGGLRAKILRSFYRTVVQQLRLLQKGEFREKFGTYDDLVYICYPFMGLGVSGSRTLIRFFEDEM